MALLFCESFDHEGSNGQATSTHLASKWDTSVEIGNNSSFTTGRFSTLGWAVGNSSNYLEKIIGVNASTLICSFAYGTSVVSGQVICSFFDGTTNQVNIRVNSSGFIEAYRNTTLLGTATTGSIPATSVYRSIEVKVTFHGSTGAVTVKVEGATVLSLTGQNTIVSANAYANRFRLGNSYGVGTNAGFYDDLALADDTGSTANDFLGDVRVERLIPSGAGATAQFTPSAGSNFQCVDDVSPPNDDTDYVSDGTTGHKDTYAFGDLTPTSGTVYGVQVSAWNRKDDAGAMSLSTVARLSATDDVATARACNVAYAFLTDMRNAKPGGGTWSISDVNSAEFGVQVG